MVANLTLVAKTLNKEREGPGVSTCTDAQWKVRTRQILQVENIEVLAQSVLFAMDFAGLNYKLQLSNTGLYLAGIGEGGAHAVAS